MNVSIDLHNSYNYNGLELRYTNNQRYFTGSMEPGNCVMIKQHYIHEHTTGVQFKLYFQPCIK